MQQVIITVAHGIVILQTLGVNDYLAIR